MSKNFAAETNVFQQKRSYWMINENNLMKGGCMMSKLNQCVVPHATYSNEYCEYLTPC